MGLSSVVWLLAVPKCAVLLTRRFVEVRGRSEASTPSDNAFSPLLSLLAVGGLVLFGSFWATDFQTLFTRADSGRSFAWLSWVFGAGLTFAVLAFGRAFFWSNRIAGSLRRFDGKLRFAGTLSPECEGDPIGRQPALVFETDDGAHRVRVPAVQVLAPPPEVWGRAPAGSASFFCNAPLQPMSFRSAYCECASDALIVVGTEQAAIARAVRTARENAVWLGIVALLGVLMASATVLVAL